MVGIPYMRPISRFKLSLLFETFPEKYKKKLVTHFWNTPHHRNSKVKIRNYPWNIQLFPEPKGRNLKNILDPKKGLKTAKITQFFQIFFSQTFSPGLEPFMTKLIFFLIFSNPYSSEWKFDCRRFGVFFFKEKIKIKKLPLK